MVAILYADFIIWNHERRLETLSLFISSLVLAGCFAMLKPLVCMEIMIAGAIWIGIKVGNQAWYKIKVFNWVTEAHLSITSILAGKFLSALAIYFLQGIIVSPVLIIMKVLWGTPLIIFAKILPFVMISCIIATSLSLIITSHQTTEEDNEQSYFTYLLVGLWLLITWLIKPLQMTNPFFIVNEIIASRDLLPFTIPVILLNISVMALILGISYFRIFMVRRVEAAK